MDRSEIYPKLSGLSPHAYPPAEQPKREEARAVVIGEQTIPIDQDSMKVSRSSFPPPTGTTIAPAAIEEMARRAATPPLLGTLLSILKKGILPGIGARSSDATHLDRVCVNINRSTADFKDAIESPARGALPLSLERENDPLTNLMEERARELRSTILKLMEDYTSTGKVNALLLEKKQVLETVTKETDEETWRQLQTRVESSALLVMKGGKLPIDQESPSEEMKELLEWGNGEHWIKERIAPESFSHVLLSDLPQYRRHEESLRAAAGESVKIHFVPLVEGKVHYYQAGSQPIKALLNHPNYLDCLSQIWNQEFKQGEICVTHACRSPVQ